MATLRLTDFSGGLNQIAKGNKIRDNETPSCYNVVYDDEGIITKKPGYQLVIDLLTGTKITGLYIFHKKDGTSYFLVSSGVNLYLIEGIGGTPTKTLINTSLSSPESFTSSYDVFVNLNKIQLKTDSETVTDGTTTFTRGTDYEMDYINGQIKVLSTGTMLDATSYTSTYDYAYQLTAGEPLSFTTYADTCFIANGKEPLLEYDGTTVTENLDAPLGKYVVALNNILFIAGNETYPSSVYYSDIGMSDTDGDGYVWKNEDLSPQKIDVMTDDGDLINAITKQMGNLVIFKSNSIHALYGTGPSSFSLREIQAAIGCVSPRSVVNIENYIFFLARDGVRVFDGSSANLISQKVNPTIKQIADTDLVSGAYYDHHYFLSYPEGASTSNNRILAYNTQHKSWTMFKDMNCEIFNNFDGSQDGQATAENIYFGDSATGKIYQYGIGNSANGVDIEVYYETPYFDIEQPEIIKTFRRIMVDSLSQGDFTLTYDVDRGVYSGSYSIDGQETNDNYLWGMCNWGELIWHTPVSKLFGASLRNAHGRKIRFIVSESSSSSLKINGIICKARLRRERFG